MNLKYLYVWLMVVIGSFETVLLADSSKGTYFVDHKAVNAFYSNKFSDEQRQAMVEFLNEQGLLSQASMQGTMTALEHADIDALVARASRTFLTDVDRRNFPEKFGKEFIQVINRSGFAKEFGKGLSDGLVSGLSKNLEDNKAVADLTKSINKSVKEVSDGMSADFDKTIGKDSQLGKKTKETLGYYADLGANAYDRLVLGSMIKSGVVLVAITAALYSVPFAIRTIERNMKRPKLIIESSQLTIMEQFHAACFGPEKKQPMEAMVFSPTLKKYLDDIVSIVSKSHAKIKEGKTNIKYRNLMLYGPPGTGKTMFAKELARCSGLEFACMSGSSFSKFQEGEAIEALDELFAWAKKCNGLMIFIDEAETFLSKRENMDPQSKAYQLLNNFLNYTGQRSSNFMIVFATNHKDVLDSAMYRRIDDLIEMPLPCKQQRIDTLHLYKSKILMDTQQNEKTLTVSVNHFLTSAVIEQIAQDTKGLSYGELEGIINNIKTEADILDKPAVHAGLIKTVVDRVVKKHHDFTGGQHLGCIEN
ncbi:MAG: AAA family ATPase [Candidatus Chromulinivorax sp.]|nr:AAA family ATPase [Candidatus Chromulinivorax sp.]